MVHYQVVSRRSGKALGHAFGPSSAREVVQQYLDSGVSSETLALRIRDERGEQLLVGPVLERWARLHALRQAARQRSGRTNLY